MTASPAKLDFKVIDGLAANSIKDPVLFAKEWLKVDLWDKQKEILRAIARDRQVVVKACHSSGKTFVAAVATLWWLARWPECRVITTGPTGRQVTDLVWTEIGNLARNADYPFPKTQSEGLLQTEIRIDNNHKRKATGFTTSVEGDEGTKFQGYHAPKVLVILDEAPGIDSAIWMAVRGLLASGDTRLLALGNPTIPSGPFYDSFGVNRASWHCFTISAFDTPNLQGLTLETLLKLNSDELGKSKIDYLVSRHWVVDTYRELGPAHPHFIARVLGDFPSQSPDSLLSLTWLERAKNKIIFRTEKKLAAGLDVAGPGEDETVLVIRDGESIIFNKAWPNPDPRGEVVQALLPYKDKIEINVDSDGIGYYIARHLEDLGFVVSDVHAGAATHDRERYVNLKAEMYWGLRMRLESGEMAGLVDDLAIAQLSSIRYKLNSRGQIEIESKEAAAKRGVKSPDRAEAIMLAFAPSFQHGLFGYWEELALLADKPTDVHTDASTLSDAQKEVAGYVDTFNDSLYGNPNLMNHRDELQGKTGIATLGKVMTSKQQPKVCPNCSNHFLALYGEGAWRCNGCGASSKDEIINAGGS